MRGDLRGGVLSGDGGYWEGILGRGGKVLGFLGDLMRGMYGGGPRGRLGGLEKVLGGSWGKPKVGRGSSGGRHVSRGRRCPWF